MRASWHVHTVRSITVATGRSRAGQRASGTVGEGTGRPSRRHGKTPKVNGAWGVETRGGGKMGSNLRLPPWDQRWSSRRLQTPVAPHAQSGHTRQCRGAAVKCRPGRMTGSRDDMCSAAQRGDLAVGSAPCFRLPLQRRRSPGAHVGEERGVTDKRRGGRQYDEPADALARR